MAFGADNIAVIPLRTSPAPSVGTHQQMTYNNAGSAAGADVFYDRKNSRFGIGVDVPETDLDVDGIVEANEFFIDGKSIGTNTDNVISGNLGIGFDSVQGQNFGDNVIILKENNLRIVFTGAADNNKSDWRLQINDNANEGDNYFSIFEIPKDYDMDEVDPTLPVPFKISSDGTHGPQRIVTIQKASGNIGLSVDNPKSKLQVSGYFQQSPMEPPSADCDEAKEHGRIQPSSAGALFICTDFGWLMK